MSYDSSDNKYYTRMVPLLDSKNIDVLKEVVQFLSSSSDETICSESLEDVKIGDGVRIYAGKQTVDIDLNTKLSKDDVEGLISLLESHQGDWSQIATGLKEFKNSIDEDSKISVSIEKIQH